MGKGFVMKIRTLLQVTSLSILLVGRFASAQDTTGAISGTVKDSTSAVIPKAKVEVLNDDTGISRTLETDSDGRYSARSLPLGSYRVVASAEGFQTVVRSGIA